jgi:hypothetical protein
VPEGCEVLSEWDVLPKPLAEALKRATALVVLDPLSFPFETVEGEGWTVPFVFAPREDSDAGTLAALFGPGLLDRIGPFDHVATDDDALWEDLKGRYRLPEARRLRVGRDPAEVAAGLCALLLEEPGLPNVLRDPFEEERFWAMRGGLVEGVRGGLHRRLGFDKAVHLAQAGALEPQLLEARVGSAPDVALDVLEVGCRAGRWAAAVAALPGVRYVGAELDEGLLRAARAGLPGVRFDALGKDARLPYEDEAFDVVFAVSAMRYLGEEEKVAMVSEMWRVAKPGGRILLLEEFVSEKRPSGTLAVHPRTVSIGAFVRLVTGATAWGVSLEHVETLRYPHDGLIKSAVISLAKLGVPKTW